MIVHYLSIIDVVAIHDLQIERFGGADGLRDPGALESALFRPQSGYYKDIIQEAAALWESLSQNHPFVDGNKAEKRRWTLSKIAMKMQKPIMKSSTLGSAKIRKQSYDRPCSCYRRVRFYR